MDYNYVGVTDWDVWPSSSGTWGFFNGIIDELQIYNVALTKEQIVTSFNALDKSSALTPNPMPTQTSNLTSTPKTTQSQTPLETNYIVWSVVAIGAFALSLALVFVFQRRRSKPIKTVESLSTNNLSPNSNPDVVAPIVRHIFISHVEEDADVAKAIAKGLEKVGFRTWYYERDSKPGPSYLLQTSKAIEESQAIIVVISPHSLSSRQVTVEVIRGHEAGKHFVPLLRGISHLEFQKRQPEWREAIGSATSTDIPEKGVTAILPRIIAGLTELGVKTGEKTKSPTS
jgi:hypothetical protein